MLTITATVTKIEPDYVYLSEIKEHGIPLEIESHKLYSGKWSKRLTPERIGSTVAFNATLEHFTISGFDGESRYTADRLSIRKPSMAQIVKSANLSE